MESTLNDRSDLDAEFKELPEETEETPKIDINLKAITIAKISMIKSKIYIRLIQKHETT